MIRRNDPLTLPILVLVNMWMGGVMGISSGMFISVVDCLRGD